MSAATISRFSRSGILSARETGKPDAPPVFAALRVSVHGDVLAGGGLGLGPHGLGGVEVLAKLLEVEDVEVGRGLDEVHQQLGELGVLVEVAELGRDPGEVGVLPDKLGHGVLVDEDVGGVGGGVLLGDGHHLDEVPDGVLAVGGGAAPALDPPLGGAAVYHWKRERGKPKFTTGSFSYFGN